MLEHISFEPSLMSACPCVKGRVTQPVRNSSLSCDLAPFTLPQAGNRVFIAVSYELGDLTISLWSGDPIYYLKRYETCRQKDQVREGGWGKIIWHFWSCICIFVCHCMYIHLLTKVVIAILSQVLFVNLVCTRARWIGPLEQKLLKMKTGHMYSYVKLNFKVGLFSCNF